MINAVFILTVYGEVIVSKVWMSTDARLLLTSYWKNISSLGGITRAPHTMILDGNMYCFHHKNDVQDIPTLIPIEFMVTLTEVLHAYFGEVSEWTLKSHFSLTYQLLDEMLVNGFPTNTHMNILQEIVKPVSLLNKVVSAVSGSSFISGELPACAVTTTPWRSRDLKYAQNEIYFDIEEEINGVVNGDGNTIRSSVTGRIICNARMTGMPDLSVSLMESNTIDNVSFHPCVRVDQWEKGRVLSFIPPDGVFVLASYSGIRGKKYSSPIYCNPQISVSANGHGKISIMVGSRIALSAAERKTFFENIVISFKLPSEVETADLKANFGSVIHDSSLHHCSWKIANLPKDVSPLLQGSFTLTKDHRLNHNIDIGIKFTSQCKPLTGLKIKDLKLKHDNYKVYKGSRSTVKAGNYAIRITPM